VAVDVDGSMDDPLTNRCMAVGRLPPSRLTGSMLSELTIDGKRHQIGGHVRRIEIGGQSVFG